MVIVKLVGGLGNQLFQYAAGYALARQSGASLLLDTGSYASDQLRGFALASLHAPITIAADDQIRQCRAEGPIQRAWQRMLPAGYKRFYKQPGFRFDPDFFKLSPPVYLQGYFQSERFFAGAEQEIRSVFQMKAIRPEIKEFGNRLRSELSVSIHVRRSDYKQAESLRVHGVLSPDYYRAAIRRLQASLGEAVQLYLFSDDPVAVLAEGWLPQIQTISGLVTENQFEDLYLMSCCRHHIIANSSFSWWGAWLNEDPGKQVLAPAKWFNEGPRDTQDLLPASWMRL